VLTFIRKAAPFAYCDACLALRVDAALSEAVSVLAALVADGECDRRRRVCYGCGRTLEIAALKDGVPRA
jgi:hypothetical protein